MHQLRNERAEQNLTTEDIASERTRNEPQLVNREIPTEDKVETVRDSEVSRDLHQEGRSVLVPEAEMQQLRVRWEKIQIGFVDEPRQAVKQADELIASAIQQIAEQFAQERARLEKQWDRGDQVSTEDLRQALRRYRTFFDRLLSV
jgi:hypothetical protein